MSVREMTAGKTRYVLSKEELRKLGIEARCDAHIYCEKHASREHAIRALKARIR